VGVYSQKPIETKKEEGDTRCRPFSLVALMAPAAASEERDTRSVGQSSKAPLRQQQRKGQHKVLANP
jgi:hypothetical protein